jgi:hypothetical protein
VAVVEPEARPVPLPVTLRAAAFRDDDGDAHRDTGEAGLAGSVVLVHGAAWSGRFVADARGLVTVTLPGAGVYTFHLSGRPGGNWRATTRIPLCVRVGGEGDVEVLAGRGDALPPGTGQGVAFAFGLAMRRATLWIPLAAAGLLALAVLVAASDRRAEMIRRLEQTIGG